MLKSSFSSSANVESLCKCKCLWMIDKYVQNPIITDSFTWMFTAQDFLPTDTSFYGLLTPRLYGAHNKHIEILRFWVVGPALWECAQVPWTQIFHMCSMNLFFLHFIVTSTQVSRTKSRWMQCVSVGRDTWEWVCMCICAHMNVECRVSC